MQLGLDRLIRLAPKRLQRRREGCSGLAKTSLMTDRQGLIKNFPVWHLASLPLLSEHKIYNYEPDVKAPSSLQTLQRLRLPGLGHILTYCYFLLKLHGMTRSLCLFVCLTFLTSATAQRSRLPSHIIKPNAGDLAKLNVYADNWFKLYINGKLIAVDSIEFMPHNIISVEVLPEYPMTIAVMARDNADAITGREYEHTQIGDGGFILKLGDHAVSSSDWKAKCFFFGPIEGEKPPVRHLPIPTDWFSVDFDDSGWEAATEYEEAVVRPPRPFRDYNFEGAKFIWTSDLDLHNTVIFRATIEKSGWEPRWDTGTPARRIEDLEK